MLSGIPVSAHTRTEGQHQAGYVFVRNIRACTFVTFSLHPHFVHIMYVMSHVRAPFLFYFRLTFHPCHRFVGQIKVSIPKRGVRESPKPSTKQGMHLCIHICWVFSASPILYTLCF